MLSALLTLPLLAVPQVQEAAAADETGASAWIRRNAHPLAGVEPESGSEDLAALGALAEARVVALGDTTRGARALEGLKERVTRYLCGEHGFSLVALHADVPGVRRLDAWANGGAGDPVALIAALDPPSQRTEELLSLVAWARAFNAAGKGPVRFVGIDPTWPESAMSEVLAFVKRYDAHFAPELEETYARIATARVGSTSPFGSASGTLPFASLAGKRVAFSGWIRTEGVTDGHAGLWLRASGTRAGYQFFDDMQDRGPRGDTPWTRYEVGDQFGDDILFVHFGAVLHGRGKAWFDGFEVTVDGQPLEGLTDLDLDFEQGIVGFDVSHPPYHATLEEGAHSGRQCLALQFVDPASMGEVEPMDAVRHAIRVKLHLRGDRATVLAKVPDAEFEWAAHNANLVSQAMQIRNGDTGFFEAKSLGENLLRALEEAPEAKVVLWTHDEHAGRAPRALGAFLADRFGRAYVPLALTASRGEELSSTERPRTRPLVQAPPDSLEAHCATVGVSALALDLRGASDAGAEAAWLVSGAPMRTHARADEAFPASPLARRFDWVLWVDQTAAARALAR